MSKLTKIKEILFENNKHVFGDVTLDVTSEDIIIISSDTISHTFHISKVIYIQVVDLDVYTEGVKKEVEININVAGGEIEAIKLDISQSASLVKYLTRLINDYYKAKRLSTILKYFIAIFIALLGVIYFSAATNGLLVDKNITRGAGTVMTTERAVLPSEPSPEDPLLTLIDTLAKPNDKLAALLKKGAATGDYSISLTVPSGYTDPNPIYVFSDPNCPHCRAIEPLLENLSLMHPVVIFPVTAIGGRESAKVASSTLCEQQQNRKDSWQNVIKGREIEINECQQGSLALKDNDKTYQYFKFIGTPTIVRADGAVFPATMEMTEKNIADWARAVKK